MTRIILILFLAVGLQSFAQSQDIDPRLSDRFSKDQLAQMDESRIAYWTYYLNDSFQIMDIPAEKASFLTDLEVIDIPSSDFHGFSIVLDSYQKDGAYLRFKGEDKMVMIKPIKQFIEDFNAHYQSTKI